MINLAEMEPTHEASPPPEEVESIFADPDVLRDFLLRASETELAALEIGSDSELDVLTGALRTLYSSYASAEDIDEEDSDPDEEQRPDTPLPEGVVRIFERANDAIFRFHSGMPRRKNLTGPIFAKALRLFEAFDDHLPLEVAEQGACSGSDTDKFFPQGQGHGRKGLEFVKNICEPCKIKTACLDAAIATDAPGLWAATTRAERRKMAKEAKKAKER